MAFLMNSTKNGSVRSAWLMLVLPWILLALTIHAQSPGGTVLGWGQNQTTPPAGLTNVSAVAVGGSGNLVLNNDGTVVGWGYTSLPSGLSNVEAVAIGQNWNLALMSNGTVAASGSLPSDLANVAAISVCSDYCLALKRDGSVESWGVGFDGTFYVTPQPPADLTNAVAISAGQAHGVALRRDGTVIAWGSNVYGQTNLPSSLTNVVALAAGQYHTVALNADGSLTVWGVAPVPPAETNVVAISSGTYFYLALMGDGTVSGWGVNDAVPAGLTGAVGVAAGGFDSAVVFETNDFCFASRQTVTPTVFNGTTFFIRSAIADFPISAYQWRLNGTNISGATNKLLTLQSVPLSGAGNYSVVVSNLYGVFTSADVVLRVTTSPPFVTTQPVSLTVVPGTNTALSVSAGGSLPIYYQWQFNGTNIADATNSVLSFATAMPGNRGYYDVVLSNAYGTVVSSNVFLHVLDAGDALNATNLAWSSGGNAPWFVQTASTYDGVAAMQSGSIYAGQQSTLQTTVTGPGTLKFWWAAWYCSVYNTNYLGFSINGAEQSRCFSGTLQWSQQTIYLGDGVQMLQWIFYEFDPGDCPPGTDYGLLDEVNYTIGGTMPFLTLNPSNQVVVLGSNATLNATALGTPPLYYQWQLNGTNVEGATNTTRSLSNVQFANAGNYSVVVSNAFGVTNTTTAFLNVVDFTASLNATNLTWSSSGNAPWFPETGITHDGIAALQSGSLSGNQQSTVSTTVSGPGTLSFWWKVSSETNNDYVNFTVDGVEQARNSGLLNQWQQKTFYLINGTHSLTWTYTKNAAINSGSDAAWLDQVSYVSGGTAAFAMSGPTDQIVPIFSSATFIVTAGGTPPTSYQWLFNSSAIPSATNSSLTITNVQVTNSGNYSVVLANDYGSSTSSNAFLYLLNVYAWGAGKTNTVTTPNSGQSIVPTNLIGVKAIAGGGYHSMVLLNSGRVVAWGYNSYGQTNSPSTLTNASAIAAGLYHSLALRSNGTVTAWGYSGYGQTTVPSSATNIMAIAAGWYHNLAVRSNGTVVAWGAGTSRSSPPYYSGQSIVPTNLAGVTAIAAGGYHSLALRTDGTVVAWGWNAFGQTNVPLGLSNVVAIAAGGSNSVALKNDGTLVAWGANGNGQTNIPNGLTNVVAIRCGAAHNLALLNDGSLMSWGLNANGQTNVPANVTNVAAIAAGGYHSLALVNAGPITFLNPPYSLTIFKGSNAVFNPAVLGLDPINFQWQQNGTNVPNATNAVLQISNAQFSDPGNYRLAASNAFGVVISAVAVLTVNDTAPFFTVQPTNVATLQNSNFTLSASAGGLPPFAYQWCLNGAPIAAATNLVLTVTNAQLTNEGFYSLLASNAYGTAVSSNAFVDVIDVPQALGLTNVSWFNPGLPLWFAESTNTHDGFAAAASGLLPYGYQNFIRTFIAGPGTLSFWCNGNQGVTLTFAIDDTQQTSQQFYNGGSWRQFTYYLPAKVHMLTWTAINQYTSFYSNIVFLDDVVFTPGNTSVKITSQPSSQTNLAGINVTFSVAAAGTPPLNYQWYFDGAAILGATSASLGLNDIQLNNAGNYSVAVSGPSNTVVSSNAVLTVSPSAPVVSTQPAGGAVLLGGPFTFTGGATGTEPMYYQWLFNNLPIPGASGTSLTVSNAQYSDGGSYTLIASNSVGVTARSNALLVPYSLGDLGTALDNSSLAWTTTNVPWFPQTNTTHDGVSAAQSGAISGTQSSTLQTTVTGPAMVVYWWKVNCDSFWDALAFSANGSEQSTITGNVDWQLMTNFIGSGTQVLQWNLRPNYTAFAGGTAWLDQVQIIPIAGTAPVITAQTGDMNTNAGNDVVFSVTATGTTPLRYQWQLNSADMPGWTNSTLTLNNVQIVNAGTYSVTITNDFGPATSTNLNLTVNNSAPVIAGQPAPQTNVVNASATFTVYAKGSTPLSYQWFFNSAAISGAISNSLIVANLQPDSAGKYSVVVSNAYGQATSINARLTVIPSIVLRVFDYLPYGYASMVQPTNIGNVTAIAAGALHTLALRKDGTVIAWGNNFYGQTNIPAGLSNVVAIAAGNNHCLALKSDGSLAAWGDYGYGQGGVPVGLSNVVAIASGAYYNLALKADGTVIGWGSDIYGQTDVPAGLTNVQSIFAGYYNGCAVKSDGSLVQWGNGPVWQHNGTNTQLSFAGSNFVSIAAAAFTGWSLQNDGVARAYGFYDGSAPCTNSYSGLTAWNTGIRSPNIYPGTVAIAASGTGGPLYDYVLLLNGSGFITEVNVNGGSGGIGKGSIPYISSNPGNVTAVAANNQHAVALISDGSPRINWPPLSRVVFSGATVAFNLNASGAAPLNYQWQINGTNIDSATNTTLILTNVPLSASGDYTCIVSNSVGSVSTLNATLAVLRSAPYFNTMSASFGSSNGFSLELDQLSGHGSIIVYASTNLVDWVPILTNPPQLGPLELVDPKATNMPARFYRAEEY
jgi:alpha-tubulin suppressor-like RCC1 family protein